MSYTRIQALLSQVPMIGIMYTAYHVCVRSRAHYVLSILIVTGATPPSSRKPYHVAAGVQELVLPQHSAYGRLAAQPVDKTILDTSLSLNASSCMHAQGRLFTARNQELDKGLFLAWN